jgi:hypothetical protein
MCSIDSGAVKRFHLSSDEYCSIVVVVAVMEVHRDLAIVTFNPWSQPVHRHLI